MYSRKSDLLSIEIGKTGQKLTFGAKPHLTLSIAPKTQTRFSNESISITLSKVDSNSLSTLDNIDI